MNFQWSSYIFEQPNRLGVVLLLSSAQLWRTLLYLVRPIRLVMLSVTVVLFFRLVKLMNCLVVRKMYGHPCYRHVKVSCFLFINTKNQTLFVHVQYMKCNIKFLMTNGFLSKVENTKLWMQNHNYINDLIFLNIICIANHFYLQVRCKKN